MSQIKHRAPRPVPEDKAPTPTAPAGRYRVTHGKVCLPRDESEWKHPATGQQMPGELPHEYAHPGDIIELSAEDATMMLEQGVIEPEEGPPKKKRRAA